MFVKYRGEAFRTRLPQEPAVTRLAKYVTVFTGGVQD